MFNSRSNYVKFTAWTNLDSYNISQERLLTKEILIAITSELAKKSGKFNDTSYCSVLVAPEIFEKFIITETGLNYTVQTVDVLRLLEYWEALGFPFILILLPLTFIRVGLYLMWELVSQKIFRLLT